MNKVKYDTDMNNENENDTNENDTNEMNEDDMNDMEVNEDETFDMDKMFIDNIIFIKHSLYKKYILDIPEDSEESQNNNVLNKYINKLNLFYNMSIQSQNNEKIETLNKFPKSLRKVITTTLEWIRNFFNSNHIIDTIPYSYYIKAHCITYPFVQNNSFIIE